MPLKSAALSAVIASVLSFGASSLYAAEHVVKMLNSDGKGDFMVFEPAFIRAEPGDTVKFVSTDPGHNAETMPEIWPEGAATFQGKMSEDVTLTIDKPGIYGVKCLPHYPLGMIAMVVAGDPVNADQLEAFKPPAGVFKKRFEALAQQVTE
ncbi:MAG: pseudoazurin [Pseudomonadota bacterium]